MKLIETDFYFISGLMFGFEWVESEYALVVDLLFLRITLSFESPYDE